MADSLKTQLKSSVGQTRLLESIKKQKLVEHDHSLASALIKAGELVEFAAGETLMNQGDTDNDAYLIIEGEAIIVVNGREVAKRKAEDSIGEMALIDSAVRRSATAIAISTVTALKISEISFKSITTSNANVWRKLAIILAERLRERSKFHRAPNSRPVLFIGSSVEGLPLAEAIHLALKHSKIDVRPWNRPGLFGAGASSIESLIKEVDLCDFAVFIFGADDKLFSREEKYDVPRDNIVFELGLFMGRLGRERSFVVKEQNAALKLPTDLLGITPITYIAQPTNDLTSPAMIIATELQTCTRAIGVI